MNNPFKLKNYPARYQTGGSLTRDGWFQKSNLIICTIPNDPAVRYSPRRFVMEFEPHSFFVYFVLKNYMVIVSNTKSYDET
jgi:hypothetical protein